MRVLKLQIGTLRYMSIKSSSFMNDTLQEAVKPQLTHKHKLSSKAFDAPPMEVRWFYAVDRPVRPSKIKGMPPSKEEAKVAQKYEPFRVEDSRVIEAVYQKTPDLPNSSSLTVEDQKKFNVQVNEDRLFEVNIIDREIMPVYWDGPVYHVLRGTWHFQDATSTRPCNESLATQIEEGYLHFRPFQQTKPLLEETKTITNSPNSSNPPSPTAKNANTWKLLGKYTGKFVVYTGNTTAYLLSDDLYGKMSSAFISSLTAGHYLGGQKLVRGYKAKSAEEKSSSKGERIPKEDLPVIALDKLMEGENQMLYDFNRTSRNNNRKVSHLILCCHGIGQKFSDKLTFFQFSHQVNLLRKNFKSTYRMSDELQGLLNNKDSENCEVQVLPIYWRDKIHLGGIAVEHSHENNDNVTDAELTDKTKSFTTLDDITVDGMPGIREIVSDILLDVLLFYQPGYKEKIQLAVAEELNRVYHLYKKENPDFDGQVSIIGHSLGSAIVFDILSLKQAESQGVFFPSKKDNSLKLDFDVNHFFSVGSPIGLFQMLRGQLIGKSETPAPPTAMLSPLKLLRIGTSSVPSSIETAPECCPKCENFYNIFYTTDPVAYRVEPLVWQGAAKLRPESVPNVKGWMRNQLAGLQDFSIKLAEGATGIFTGLTQGIKKTIFTSKEDMRNSLQEERVPKAQPAVVDTDLYDPEMQDQKTFYDKVSAGDSGSDSGSTRLKMLNHNGRLDYVIQGGIWESNYITSLASHMSYWTDQDLTHFIMQQLYLCDRKKDQTQKNVRTDKT